MADEETATKSAGKGLTRKVGPLPVWGWAVIGFGVYYWYTHYGPGAASSTATGKGTPGSVTVGNITLSTTGRGARGTKTTTTTTGTGGKPAHKCPPGFFWDPDDRGGKGRCVKIKGHKGPDKPGSDNTAQRKPGTGGTTTATATTGTPEGGVSQSVLISPQAVPTGGPVNAQTGQPVFEEWQHAHRGPQVPPPVEAFAPQTNGAVYGPAAVDVAAQSLD